jgi:transposase
LAKLAPSGPAAQNKIEYYLERRDAEFEAKMIEVLHVCREVAVWRKTGLPREVVGVLSYDEKPGIQAIGNTAPDLPPVPGRHAALGRDDEYQRYGTLSLLAGVDLLSGEVLGLVRERHRSQEFVEFLGLANPHYPPGSRIRVVLDNHSGHVSRETRAYLTSVPNRFEFVFIPKHGSWLNRVESLFGKLARTLLRGIRVTSKPELRARIELYLKEMNEEPTVFKWKYKLEALATESVALT